MNEPREHHDQVEGSVREGDEFDDPRLLAALREYAAAVDAGRRPSRQELLARHPDIARELSACLQGAAFLESAVAQMNADPILRGDEQRQLEADLSGAHAQPLGDFKLIREIGRGGMGIVYEAVQLSLGRRVAVKVLPLAGALDPRHLARFRNEAQAAAQLHHTNIVPVYAVGYERGVHFYAMQLIEGQSLASVIAALRVSGGHDDAGAFDANVAQRAAVVEHVSNLSSLRLSKRGSYFQAVARMGVQAAGALDFAHQLGVVHRDVKPANLLLDPHGTVWVTDFGLAQIYVDTGLTQPGDVLGTLRYMSPEQASGRAVVLDQRTDVYSLGVTLYELLTLHRAIEGETRAELLHNILDVDARPLRAVDRAIPTELETIIAKSIAKEPDERYASARELANDLERFLRDEPIRARPPSARDKAVKWVRRHRAVAVSAFAVLLVAAIGLLVTTVLVAQANALERDQRRRAEVSMRQARDAVDFFTDFAANELPKDPSFLRARRELLDQALAFHQKFLEQRKDDPFVAGELKAAQERVTSLLAELAAVNDTERLRFSKRLLQHAAVQQELALSAEQLSALGKVWQTEFPRPMSEPVTEFAGFTATRRRELIEGAVHESDAELDRVLAPAQSLRLREITRQGRGIYALEDSDVARALALTPDQRRKLRVAQASLEPKPGGPKPATMPVDRHKRNEAALAEVLTLMSPRQVETWHALIGEPFKVPMQHEPFGPHGPGGRGGPGGPPPKREPGSRN